MTEEAAAYDAAAAIDALLGADDGTILAAMAQYRSSLVTLFGRDGVVELLRKAVDDAPNVEYFTRRSRREIDPARPQVNLKVDDVGAMAAHPSLVPVGLRSKGSFGNGATEKEQEAIVAFKSAVLYEEVCMPMAKVMNEALQRHWNKAKGVLETRGADHAAAVLLLTNLFVVRVTQDTRVASPDKMCILGLFV